MSYSIDWMPGYCIVRFGDILDHDVLRNVDRELIDDLRWQSLEYLVWNYKDIRSYNFNRNEITLRGVADASRLNPKLKVVHILADPREHAVIEAYFERIKAHCPEWQQVIVDSQKAAYEWMNENSQAEVGFP